MRPRRAPRPLRALVLLLCLGASAAPFAACRGSAALVGAGGDCLLATDCAPGLVCVAQRSGARICTDDLSRVGGRPIPDGAAPREAGEGGDADPDAPVAPDTGQPDVTPQDTGTPDTGPVDTGTEGG